MNLSEPKLSRDRRTGPIPLPLGQFILDPMPSKNEQQASGLKPQVTAPGAPGLKPGLLSSKAPSDLKGTTHEPDTHITEGGGE